MKIVIFGIGRFYKNRKEELLSYEDVEVVAAIDNNSRLHGTSVDGIFVFAVEQVKTINFDIILLMSLKADEMKKQLLDIGIDIRKIWYWKRFKGEKEKGNFHFYCGDSGIYSKRRKVLILSTELGYHGSSLAAVYAAKALQMHNYNVVLAASGGNPLFLNEVKNDGLNIVICSALPYLNKEEMFFIGQFDFVIVNTFSMISCVSAISEIRPVIWWIHEASHVYETSLNQFDDCTSEKNFKKVNIYAVSEVAQRNFNYYFFNRIKENLAYGIPDERNITCEKDRNDKLVFAVIGGINELKAQDIFLKAVQRLPEELKSNGLFWIIGKGGQDVYGNEIREMIGQDSSIVFWGEMTRTEIRKIYRNIDVLVCPSWEDCLPIVVTEAMMYGKVVIASNMVGTTNYIKEGRNGFIFKAGDINNLVEKMGWILQHREELKKIGENARKTYEEHFTLECFGERLEKALQNSIKGEKHYR